MDDSVFASLNQVWVFLWEAVKDRYNTVPLRRCLSEYSLQSAITIGLRSYQRLHLIKNNKTLYTYAFLVWLLWRCWHLIEPLQNLIKQLAVLLLREPVDGQDTDVALSNGKRARRRKYIFRINNC